jgi:outer membrane murein-binding lipoprotein Lpp
MKMKKYIVAGIMVAALMTSGCGKFVRDELITMQNEIDILYRQVKDMNEKLVDLQALVQQMASNGYIVDVNEYQDEVHGGYTLSFRTVSPDGTVDDSYSITLLSGVDGKDGKDAEPFLLSAMRDETDGRWYWYDVQADDWMYALDGSRFLVDGKDGEEGKTPQLDIKDGYWIISWDGGEMNLN